MKTIFSVPFIALATVQGSEATGLRKRNLATSFPGGEGCANYDNPAVNHEHLCPKNKDYPTVKSIKIINQCDYPLVLTDWECQVPSKQQCTVGESCTGTNQGKEPFVSDLPMCSDSGHKMRSKMTSPDRIDWHIPGSRGVGDDANYHISDFLEINQPNFHGPGDKLGHTSFSQWQGYSMSKQYVTRDATTGALACLDSGGKTTVPDPKIAADGQSLKCGDEAMQCGGTGKKCDRPFHLCYPPEYSLQENPDYLKKHAVAINRDGTEAPFLNSICNAVDYVCSDHCMTSTHNWSAGTQLCDCPNEVDLEITICGVH